MLSRCCNLTTLSIPFPLSFASLDTHGNGIAESSWLTDYYNNSCRYRLCDDHDARAMLACVEFFSCFFDQGIGSRSAARASKVDVVWVSVCVSSVVGWCSYVRWCCILVALYALCMYPHLLCNVDVMISTLQKRLQDALLSLVAPSSSFRIGPHIGRDTFVSEPRPTIGAHLIDRSLAIVESRRKLFSEYSYTGE